MNQDASIKTLDAMVDIVAYREGVEILMKQGSSVIISNGIPEHAAILLETFFLNAKEQILILCKNLSNAVYGKASVIEAARVAIRRGVELRIITQENIEATSFVDALKLENAPIRPDIVECAQFPKPVGNIEFNFAVMDRKAFRFEHDHNRCVASASMNSPQVADKLADLFLTMRSAKA